MGRSGGLRALGALLSAAAVVAGCGEGATAPGRAPEVRRVAPGRLVSGMVFLVEGAGLAEASFHLGGEPLEILDRGEAFARLRAPGDPRPCPVADSLAQLVARSGTATDEVEVTVLGAPRTAALASGQHAVLPLGTTGCPVRLGEPGVYGVAVFRTASPHGASDVPPLAVEMRLIPGGGRVPEASGPPPPGRTGASAPSGADRARATTPPGCERAPRPIGSTLELQSPYGTSDGTYRTVSASEHYEVLVEVDSLAAYGPARRSLVEELASALETRVHPSLARIFGEWPDSDGDGRLSILLVAGRGASYAGGRGYYPDGCPGDFVSMAHALLDGGLEAQRNNPLDVIVHEATHWYDLGGGLERKPRVPLWTVEAVASLVERMVRWERDGRPFWEPAPLPCPEAATCELRLMVENRYGLGFTREAGYSAGMHLLHYLLQQAVGSGEDPRAAAGRLRARETFPEDRRLRPIFEAMGGSGRSEAELQGEYLLSFQADEVVPGASTRILQPSWRLPELSESYPLRAFTLTSEEASAGIALGRPDGVVFEVAAAAEGALLTVDRGGEGLALALVRKQ